MKKGEVIFVVAVVIMLSFAAYFFYAGFVALFSEKYQIREETVLTAMNADLARPELPIIKLLAEEDPKNATTVLRWKANFNQGNGYSIEEKVLCGDNSSYNWYSLPLIINENSSREFLRIIKTGNRTVEYRVKSYNTTYDFYRISNTVRVYYNKSNCSYISPQILEIFPTPTYGNDNQILFVWLTKEKPQEIKLGMKLHFIIETACCGILTGDGIVTENANWWGYPAVFEILVDFDTDLREKKLIGQFKPNYELYEKERYTITVK